MTTRESNSQKMPSPRFWTRKRRMPLQPQLRQTNPRRLRPLRLLPRRRKLELRRVLQSRNLSRMLWLLKRPPLPKIRAQKRKRPSNDIDINGEHHEKTRATVHRSPGVGCMWIFPLPNHQMVRIRTTGDQGSCDWLYDPDSGVCTRKSNERFEGAQ